MGWSGHTRLSPIGIDAGAARLKAVQRARSRGRWKLAALASVPRAQPEQPITGAEVAGFLNVLRREGFVGRQAVLAAPNHLVKTTIVELPPRGGEAPVDQIARLEAARMHGRSDDAFELASWDLPPGHRGGEATHVMATTCAHTDAEPLLAACDGAGLDVLALEPAAAALARACVPWCADELTVSAVADLGWSAARLQVLYRGVTVYQRSVPDGGLRAVRDALAQRLGLEPAAVLALLEAREELELSPALAAPVGEVVQSHAGAIAAELQAALAYALHRYAQARGGTLVVAGGGAGALGLGQLVGAAAGLTVQDAAPARLLACAPALLQRAGDVGLATALGLSGYLDE